MKVLIDESLTAEGLLGAGSEVVPEVRAIVARTANGATALGTSSHGIGNDLDFALLNAARQWADCVLVGASTVRNENYFGVRTSPDAQQNRKERGQQPVPPIAVVSDSLELDPNSQFFTDTSVPPLIVTATIESPRRSALEDAGGIICTVDSTSPTVMLETLAQRGHRRILIEGGPALFGQFFAADAVDLLHLTLAPTLAPSRSSTDPEFEPRTLELEQVAPTADGYVFLRYRRRRTH